MVICEDCRHPATHAMVMKMDDAFTARPLCKQCRDKWIRIARNIKKDPGRYKKKYPRIHLDAVAGATFGKLK